MNNLSNSSGMGQAMLQQQQASQQDKENVGDYKNIQQRHTGSSSLSVYSQNH